MPANDSPGENRMTTCRACGYPTMDGNACAACMPMIAAAEGMSPVLLTAFAPAA
jgi:hypothetical protein